MELNCPENACACENWQLIIHFNVSDCIISLVFFNFFYRWKFESLVGFLLSF